MGTDPVLGTYQIKLDDMLDLMGKGQEWYNLAGAKTGRAKMMLQWKPVALQGGLGGSGGYVTPIGVMRFHFKSASGLKNLDTVGKSDPYARVLLSGIQKGRTVTYKNNLNPDWDEVFYVPVHSTREKLTVEVMDEEFTSKDRTMGQLEIAASEYIQQTESGEYAVHDSKDKLISAQVRIGHNPPKGTLNFTVAFYPCLNVADPEDETEEDKAKAETNGVVQSIENGDTAATEGSTTAAATGTVKPAEKQTDIQKALAANEKEQTETDEVQQAEVPKIKIGAEDLKNYGKCDRAA